MDLLLTSPPLTRILKRLCKRAGRWMPTCRRHTNKLMKVRISTEHETTKLHRDRMGLKISSTSANPFLIAKKWFVSVQWLYWAFKRRPQHLGLHVQNISGKNYQYTAFIERDAQNNGNRSLAFRTPYLNSPTVIGLPHRRCYAVFPQPQRNDPSSSSTGCQSFLSSLVCHHTYAFASL